jgi:hypothetical protein
MNNLSLFFALPALASLLSIASYASSSSNPLDAIRNANPGASPYQVLEKLYANAAQPALLTDFDYAGANSNMKCALADEKNNVGDANVFVRYEIVTPPATPSEGPLFPGESAQKKTILTLDGNGVDLDLEASATTMSSTPSDLIVTLTDPALDDSELPNKIFLRKNGAYIAMKSVLAFGKPAESTQYGYCWRQ